MESASFLTLSRILTFPEKINRLTMPTEEKWYFPIDIQKGLLPIISIDVQLN